MYGDVISVRSQARASISVYPRFREILREAILNGFYFMFSEGCFSLEFSELPTKSTS